MGGRGRGRRVPRWAPNRNIPPAGPSTASPTPTFINTLDIKPEDVQEVKRILAKTRNLPLELVDIILDCAQYWACSTTTIDYTNLQPGNHMSVYGSSLRENEFLLRTQPLGLTKWTPSSDDLWKVVTPPKTLEEEYPESKLLNFADAATAQASEHPVRKVVFDITSCDQGHSSHREDFGTYRSSFTWFDAGLERFDAKNECLPECPDRTSSEPNNDEDSSQPNDAEKIPTCAIRPVWPPIVPRDGKQEMRYYHELLPTADHLIQANKHASREMNHHHVEWSWDDQVDPDSVEAMKLKDIGRGPATANGEFVRNLKIGDMITVWARSRFPGWTNKIQKVEVRVYWAI